MSKKKNTPKFQVPESVSEPKADYGSQQQDKTIRFFSSFEEQDEFHRKQMALLTHEELLNNLAQMRRLFLREYLLPDGNWKPMDYIIRINTPHQ